MLCSDRMGCWASDGQKASLSAHAAGEVINYCLVHSKLEGDSFVSRSDRTLRRQIRNKLS